MQKNLSLGITLTLLSALAHAFLTALVKGTAVEIKTPIIVFMQSLICLLLFMPILFKQGTAHAKTLMKSKLMHLHLLRTIFSLGISYLLFNIIFAAIISILYWHTPLTWMIITGTLLTLLGGIFTIRVEAKTKKLCCPTN